MHQTPGPAHPHPPPLSIPSTLVCLRSQCPADNGGFGLCHGMDASAPWKHREREAAQGNKGLPLLRAGWAVRKPQGSEAKERDQEKLENLGNSFQPSSFPQNTQEERKAGGGRLLPYLSLHLAMCAAIEGPAGWADYPKGEGCGGACPHTWAGSIDVAASTV